MLKTPIILDCDPGIDDAYAIAYALSNEALDVKLITSVSGNVSIDTTTKNAQLLAGLCNGNVKICKGANKPLVGNHVFADDVHGVNGLGGYEFKTPVMAPLSEESAVDAMAKVLQDSDVPVVLVAVGPLTNVAHLLMLHPELKEKIAYLSIMGGGLDGGNTTPAGEFNIYADPYAAHYVFESGLRIVMAGLNVTETTALDLDSVKYGQSLSHVGEVLGDILIAARGGDNFVKANLHDVVSVMYVSNPEVFGTEALKVRVETEGYYSAGLTLADQRQRGREAGNTDVIVTLDTELFEKTLMEGLAKYAK